MSTFCGQTDEYPNISLDRFDGLNLNNATFFLSHNHRDHTQGLFTDSFIYKLQSRKVCKLYCSEVTKQLLLVDDLLQKYLQKWPGLEKSIVALPVEESKLIPEIDPDTGQEAEQLTVTLLPAGHCPGSVMFLIEGSHGTVLYTGDFRLEKEDLVKMKDLHSGNGVKSIHSVYIDTTFCVPNALHLPSRKQSAQQAIKIIEEWITQSPYHTVHLHHKADLGYEQLYRDLANHFKTKIHVLPKKYNEYKKIGDMQSLTTDDPSTTQIHACRTKCPRDRKKCRHQLPCEHRGPNGARLHVRTITVSTMSFVERDMVEAGCKRYGDHYYRVLYSFHSSYTEVRDMIVYLKPRVALPNVLPMHHTKQQIQERLNRFVELSKEKLEKVMTSQDVHFLGNMKNDRKRRKLSTSQYSDDAGLDFGEIGTPVKKSRNHVVEDGDQVHTSEDLPRSTVSEHGQGDVTEDDKLAFPLLFGSPHKVESMEIMEHSVENSVQTIENSIETVKNCNEKVENSVETVENSFEKVENTVEMPEKVATDETDLVNNRCESYDPSQSLFSDDAALLPEDREWLKQSVESGSVQARDCWGSGSEYCSETEDSAGSDEPEQGEVARDAASAAASSDHHSDEHDASIITASRTSIEVREATTHEKPSQVSNKHNDRQKSPTRTDDKICDDGPVQKNYTRLCQLQNECETQNECDPQKECETQKECDTENECKTQNACQTADIIETIATQSDHCVQVDTKVKTSSKLNGGSLCSNNNGFCVKLKDKDCKDCEKSRVSVSGNDDGSDRENSVQVLEIDAHSNSSGPDIELERVFYRSSRERHISEVMNDYPKKPVTKDGVGEKATPEELQRPSVMRYPTSGFHTCANLDKRYAVQGYHNLITNIEKILKSPTRSDSDDGTGGGCNATSGQDVLVVDCRGASLMTEKKKTGLASTKKVKLLDRRSKHRENFKEENEAKESGVESDEENHKVGDDTRNMEKSSSEDSVVCIDLTNDDEDLVGVDEGSEEVQVEGSATPRNSRRQHRVSTCSEWSDLDSEVGSANETEGDSQSDPVRAINKDKHKRLHKKRPHHNDNQYSSDSDSDAEGYQSENWFMDLGKIKRHELRNDFGEGSSLIDNEVIVLDDTSNDATILTCPDQSHLVDLDPEEVEICEENDKTTLELSQKEDNQDGGSDGDLKAVDLSVSGIKDNVAKSDVLQRTEEDCIVDSAPSGIKRDEDSTDFTDIKDMPGNPESLDCVVVASTSGMKGNDDSTDNHEDNRVCNTSTSGMKGNDYSTDNREDNRVCNTSNSADKEHEMNSEVKDGEDLPPNQENSGSLVDTLASGVTNDEDLKDNGDKCDIEHESMMDISASVETENEDGNRERDPDKCLGVSVKTSTVNNNESLKLDDVS